MKRLLIATFLFLFLATGAANAAVSDSFTAGKNAFEQKQYQAAITYFVQALRNEPNNAVYRYYYAQSLLYLKNYEQARKEFEYVIQLAPKELVGDYAKQSIEYIDKKNAAKVSRNAESEVVRKGLPNDNYIKKALTTNGDLVTWNPKKMPLKVYFNNSYGAKQKYITASQKALDVWKQASNGLVNFTYVSSPQEADIEIVFQGLSKKTENQILGLTRHTSSNGYIDKVKVYLYTLGPNYKVLTDIDVYNVALHEFGHMLGIWGHSDDPSDIMYALYDINNQKTMMPLTKRDKNTVKAIYEIDKNPYATTDKSITNVLGTKEDRMQTKLKQELAYIEEIPGNALGYLNVANTYKSMNDIHNAVVYYNLALRMDENNIGANEALAAIYFERKNYSKAEQHLRTLIRVQPKEPTHYCNLCQVYFKINKPAAARSTISNLIYRNSNARNEECVQKIMQHLGK